MIEEEYKGDGVVGEGRAAQEWWGRALKMFEKAIWKIPVSVGFSREN